MTRRALILASLLMGATCNSACIAPERSLSEAGAGGLAAAAGSAGSGGIAAAGTAGSAGTSSGGTGAAGCEPASPGCETVACGPCRVSNQCGCDATMKCVVIDNAGTTKCVPAGTAGPYELCTSDEECARELGCVNGVCKPYCDGSSDCVGEYRDCHAVLYDQGNENFKPILGFNVCNKNCEPHAPGACGAGAACTWFSDDGEYYNDCVGAGDGKGDHACSASDPYACAVGYGCSSTLPFPLANCGVNYACPALDFCGKYCTFGGSVPCDPGTHCLPFSALGFSYGMCVPI